MASGILHEPMTDETTSPAVTEGPARGLVASSTTKEFVEALASRKLTIVRMYYGSISKMSVVGLAAMAKT